MADIGGHRDVSVNVNRRVIRSLRIVARRPLIARTIEQRRRMYEIAGDSRPRRYSRPVRSRPMYIHLNKKKKKTLVVTRRLASSRAHSSRKSEIAGERERCKRRSTLRLACRRFKLTRGEVSIIIRRCAAARVRARLIPPLRITRFYDP